MPLRDDLLNPIPGENPSGANLKYAPVYDQIKEARREEDDVEQGVWQRTRKTADYPLAIKLASEALASKTKDVQIAAWLTEAIIHREGFAGLRQGLQLLYKLLETFWDTIYPELEDGDAELRAMPLAWVGSRLDAAIRSAPITSQGFGWRQYRDSRAVPTEEDANNDNGKRELRTESIADGKLPPEEFDSAVDATPASFYEALTAELRNVLEALAALDAFCGEKFGDVAPNFAVLRTALEEVANTVRILQLKKGGPAAAPEAVEHEAPPEEEAQYEPAHGASAPAAVRAPVRRRTQGTEPADRDDAVERILAVSRWFRREEPQSPVPYLLLRGLRWGELRAGGGDLGAALLDAPSSETRQQLKRLGQEGEWQQLLEAAEEAAGQPCGRAWLDLQRYAIAACEGQGYQPAGAAIRSELKALLEDYPQLLEATLADDTQAANAQTREMFAPPPPPAPAEPEREQPRYEPVSFEREESRQSEEPAPPDDEELIKDAIGRGRTQEAIELVMRRLGQEGSGRARFHRRVQLAQVCMAAGKEGIAYPILRELAVEIEQRKLDEWEPPGVIAHALTLLYRCLQRNGAAPEDKQKVYAAVCRLDPMQALELSQ